MARLAAGFVVFAVLVGADTPAGKLEAKRLETGGIAIHRAGQDKPILVHNAPADGRPYFHPIVAPDGKGVLTEFSPAHHKHQTGLYVGILKVNGRDYFHNRDGNYFKLKEARPVSVEGNRATWAFVYDWLGADKQPVLAETQACTFTDLGDRYIFDLDWSATAATDVTFGQYDYGGLFLRMPFKTQGKATNSEGLENGKAEGQKTKWVDVGMPIEGRDNWGRIAILDHKDNSGHPVPWRVDGQLGVGPARSRAGEWKLAKGETTKSKYRFVIYTGDFSKDRIEAEWQKWTGK